MTKVWPKAGIVGGRPRPRSPKPRESVLHGPVNEAAFADLPRPSSKSSIPPPSTCPIFLFPVVVSVPIATPSPSPPSLGHACLGHTLGASRAERAQRLACCEIPRPFSFPTPASRHFIPGPHTGVRVCFRLSAPGSIGIWKCRSQSKRGATSASRPRDHARNVADSARLISVRELGRGVDGGCERVCRMQTGPWALARTSGRAESVAQWVGS